MARQIIFHGNYFIDFYKELERKVKIKVTNVLELISKLTEYLTNSFLQ
jgi:hypothetical protein